MGVWLGPRGKSKKKLPPRFSSTGVLGTDYLYATQTDADGTVHFEIAILRPCSFTFQRVVPVELVMFGSGQDGKTGRVTDLNGYPDDYGGDGGDGGKILRIARLDLQTGTSYALSPGTNGGETTGFGYSTANTTIARKKGGKGARSYGNAFGQSYHADAGEDGEYAFAEIDDSLLFPGVRFGPGGGGGAVKNRNYYVPRNNAVGGKDGGGTGGTEGQLNGTAGATNRGSGAGGGYTFQTAHSGSTGGSGIIFIRDYRG